MSHRYIYKVSYPVSSAIFARLVYDDAKRAAASRDMPSSERIFVSLLSVRYMR